MLGMKAQMPLLVAPAFPSPRALLGAAVRRLPGMAAVWAVFGVVVGLLNPPGAGPVSIAAGITAGVLVLTPLGVALTLAGGRWAESLAGAALGLMLVPLVGLLSIPPGIPIVPLGLIFGGIVGATVVNLLYRLPRAILATARVQEPSQVRVKESVAV
jgi:hypothetical protein